MGVSDQNNLNQKIKDLEQEIFDSTHSPTPVRPFNPNGDENQGLSRLVFWYQGLATPAKVAIAVVAAIIALSVLNLVLKLVASLIAIAILGVVLYGLYRAFAASSDPDALP